MAEHVLVSADGYQLPLDGSEGVLLVWGADGRYAPPIVHVDDPAVGRDGTVLREVRFGPRDVLLPLLVDGDPLAVLRDLMTRFSPRRGDARLRHSGGGQTRELVGRIADVAAPDQLGPAGRSHVSAVVTFRAHDPFWRDPSSVQVSFALDPEPFFPVPPLALRLAELSTAAVVDQDGDTDAWPVWQLRGPSSGGPIVLARDSAAVLELDRELAVGEVVTIDTRPGRKTVVSSVAGSVYGDLTADSQLWPLLPGSQTVTVDIPSPSEETLALMSYRRRWFSP